jgi:hypothetical protein
MLKSKHPKCDTGVADNAAEEAKSQFCGVLQSQ